MMAGVSTAGAASSDSAVARSSPSGINASPARSASTGGSDAIAAQMRLQPLEDRCAAPAPIAAASFAPSGMSSKKPVEQQRGGQFGGARLAPAPRPARRG